MKLSSLYSRLGSLFNTKSIQLPKYYFLAVRLLLLMLIYSLYRLLFYWYNLDLFPEIGFNELTIIFLGGLRFDLTGLLYLNILYFMAVMLPFYFVYKTRYQTIGDAYFITINILGFLANSIDIVYFPFTLKRTTGSVFAEFQHEQGLISIFLNGFIDFWDVTLIFLVILLLFVWLVKSIKIKESSLPVKYYYIVHAALFPLMVWLMINGIRSGFGRYTRPIAVTDAGQYVKKPEQMALVLNTPFSIIRTITQNNFTIKKDFKSEAELEAVFTPIKHTHPDGPERKKNVVILIIESYSKEQSGRLNPFMQNGNYKGYTPFLDSLMGQSLYFTDAYATGRKSLDAIPAIIAGIPALNTHFVLSNYSTNKIRGLGHILKDRGYDLSFFHGAPNGSMGFNAIMKMLGFNKYFGKDEFNDDRFYDGTWGIYDEEFLQFFAKELDNMNEPFCSVLFTLSSHHPWDVPERYGNKFDDGPKRMFRTYRYMDWSMRQFFKTASKMPWYKNTLFVITADHAAYIYYDEYKNDIGALSIPMFFYTPDSSLMSEDNQVADQLDIFPTILDYLGINTPYFSFGSSLLDSTEERLACYYTRGSYRILQDSLVLQMQKNKPISLYNYLADRRLMHDLLGTMPVKEDHLEQKLRAIRQQFNNRLIRDEMTAE